MVAFKVKDYDREISKEVHLFFYSLMPTSSEIMGGWAGKAYAHTMDQVPSVVHVVLRKRMELTLSIRNRSLQQLGSSRMGELGGKS